MDPISRLCFCFIRMSVMGLTISLAEAVGLAISRAISMGREVAVGFSRLSLW